MVVGMPAYVFRSIFLFFITLSICCMNLPAPVYIDSKNQDNYPSGSTVCYLKDRFYVMGDDASDLLVLDGQLKEVERIGLFSQGENIRITKALKADVESSVVINNNGHESILLFGSGSVTPHRDSAFLVDPIKKSVDRFDLTPFYNELRHHFKQLNIEGATTVGRDLILGIRANTTYPDNYLVVASLNMLSPQFERKIRVTLTVPYAGLSGLEYDPSDDLLFITFSTEDTPNAYDDGKPGDSYLAILSAASVRLRESEIAITHYTKLTDLSPDFLHQKIESISLIKQNKQLVLVADDDLGNTTFFRLQY